jgi:AhpD family alkylhydroperoxidase
MSSTTIAQPRMKNPGLVIPEAMQAVQALIAAIQQGDAPKTALELVHLRASQINGCGFCVDHGAREARRGGETQERLSAVAAWRETPYFTEAERAALALAESATRLSDRGDAVPDQIWDAVAEHYDERQLAQLILMIAVTNFFNRVNVTIRQPAGAWA